MSFEHTQIYVPLSKRAHSLDGFDRHWAGVVADLDGERARVIDRHALVAVAVFVDDSGRARLGSWLRAEPAGGGPFALTVGAHLECDVNAVLGASLRHAAVVVDPQRGAGVGGVVDVVDLCSHDGLRADGARGLTRLSARGAVRFGVGSADVVVVTLLPGEGVEHVARKAAAAGLALSASPFARIDREKQRDDLVDLARRRERSATLELSTRDRHAVKLARDAGNRAAGERAVSDRDAHVAFTDNAEITRVNVDAIGCGKPIELTRDALTNGLLLGRSDRCARAVVEDCVSRVHALVLERGGGGELLVVDVGSTNGTDVTDGRRVTELTRARRAAVATARACVSLGGVDVRFVDRRHARPSPKLDT